MLYLGFRDRLSPPGVLWRSGKKPSNFAITIPKSSLGNTDTLVVTSSPSTLKPNDFLISALYKSGSKSLVKFGDGLKRSQGASSLVSQVDAPSIVPPVVPPIVPPDVLHVVSLVVPAVVAPLVPLFLFRW
ncbi:hypothetical protein vseg_010713 [Gypsophila vaccaria]